MTNTKLLEDKIKKSGKKKGYLAKKCGLSLAGFRNCMINKVNDKTGTISEFKASHIDILCDELGITDLGERFLIFFAKRDALNASTD